MGSQWLRTGILLAGLTAAGPAWGGIIEDVRAALAQNNAGGAASALESYRTQRGIDPEYTEALSWMGRNALLQRDYNQAYALAKRTETLAGAQLKKRKLDAEPHLPLALGAAFEVQAQVLAARGEQKQAALLLRRALNAYPSTSITARLQKNLNLITLLGKPAPALNLSEQLGAGASSLVRKKGSPVLLFFWAHWCGDCKREGPIIARLQSEYGPRGLAVIAPTQHYGYAAAGEDASPAQEKSYIQRVWERYYPALQAVPVPMSRRNFDTYGASTTPTLVLVDRKGDVAMYHPGAMAYEELRAEIEKVL